MITVYAMAERLRRPPTAAGIGGVPVEIVQHRSLALAVTRHVSPPDRSTEAVLAHAGVCEDLMSKADAVLPVRFGAVFDDEVALRSSIDERYEQLVGGLEHVRGRLEIGVRVGWDRAATTAAPRGTSEAPGDAGGHEVSTGDATGGATGGRAYLMARVEEERRRNAVQRRAEDVAGRLHEALRAPAVDSRVQVLPTDGLVMSGAYLVECPELDRMVARVRETAREHPELDVLCTGPWPPYSFADMEDIRAR